MSREKINLELSKDQAIVLLDWLVDSSDRLAEFSRAHDLKVLWQIEGQLERSLVEPFEEDYEEILQRARENVMAEG